MSNIVNLRQLHHKNLNLKRTQFRVKEFYSYEKDLVCSVLRKGSLCSRKEPGLWTNFNA